MKRFFIIIGIFIFILGLALVTKSRFQSWNNGLENKSMLGLEPFKLDEGLFNFNETQSTTTQEFISPDGQFKIQYPGDWLPLTEDNFLENLMPAELKEKYGLEMLLLAQRVKDNGLAQLIVYHGNFKEPIKEIMEEIKKNNTGVKEKIILNGEEAFWAVILTSSQNQSDFTKEINSILDSALII